MATTTKRPAFCVLRLDEGQGPIEERIAVTKVVFDLKLAKTEVDRLNEVNADKSCRYFWLPSRTVEKGEPDAPAQGL